MLFIIRKNLYLFPACLALLAWIPMARGESASISDLPVPREEYFQKIKGSDSFKKLVEHQEARRNLRISLDKMKARGAIDRPTAWRILYLQWVLQKSEEEAAFRREMLSGLKPLSSGEGFLDFLAEGSGPAR